MILGAGIYSVIGRAAGLAGDDVWLAFLVSAMVALPTALSYAELATAWPEAGAEFVYVRAAFPKRTFVPFITGCLVALSGAATAGTVAVAFAAYLRTFVDVPALPVAFGLLALMAGVNLVGVRESSVFNVVFTVIEAAGLLLVVGVALFTDGVSAPAAPSAPVTAIGSAAALAFFSFLGFENIANLSEEAKSPAKDIPRAILGSLAAAAFLYVLVALAALALLPAESLSASGSPLADALAARSPLAAKVLGAAALFATANTALISMLVSSRLVYGMAKANALPEPLAKISKRQVPWVATLVVAAVSMALVPLGSVGHIASVSSFASLLAFAVVNVVVVALRHRQPRQPRPFKTPLSIRKTPVLPVLGAVLCLALATQLEWQGLVIGAGAIAVLSGLWLIRRKEKVAAPTLKARRRSTASPKRVAPRLAD